MFILGEETTQTGSQVEFAEMGLVGEAEELATMGVELSESYSNVQMAFVRMEARAIREQASEGALSEDTQALMEEGKKDFFKRVTDAIKKYWSKFVDYLKQAVSKVQSFLTNQSKFIRENRDALREISDDQLKQTKFNRAHVIADPSVLNSIRDGASKFSKAQLDKVESGNAAATKDETFMKAALKEMKISGEAAKKGSISAAIKEAVTGTKDKDAVMTSKDVENSINVLQNAGEVQKVLQDAQAQASNAIKAAESRAKMGMTADGKERSEEVSKTLKNIQALSGRIGPVFSASVSATASAASTAKSTLSKALAATKTSSGAAQESGVASVLEQFLA